MGLAPTVRTMDISNNKITVIPVALGNFTELKQLNAEHNEIGMLPSHPPPPPRFPYPMSIGPAHLKLSSDNQVVVTKCLYQTYRASMPIYMMQQIKLVAKLVAIFGVCLYLHIHLKNS